VSCKEYLYRQLTIRKGVLKAENLAFPLKVLIIMNVSTGNEIYIFL